jgi:hypothetical protein
MGDEITVFAWLNDNFEVHNNKSILCLMVFK